jgi:act minimal PKS acyl carrier protein
MSTLTIEELKTVLIACAGEDEAIQSNADITDISFGDLGYDSLALMETVTRIARERGINVPEEEILDFDTPRDVLEAINRLIA